VYGWLVEEEETLFVWTLKFYWFLVELEELRKLMNNELVLRCYL
jgi:hypothetical protein